jgi:hypothetical protein
VTIVHVALLCVGVLAVLLVGVAVWQHRKRPYRLNDLLDLSNDEVDPDWELIRGALGRPDDPPPDPAEHTDEPADPPGKRPR